MSGDDIDQIFRNQTASQGNNGSSESDQGIKYDRQPVTSGILVDPFCLSKHICEDSLPDSLSQMFQSIKHNNLHSISNVLNITNLTQMVIDAGLHVLRGLPFPVTQ